MARRLTCSFDLQSGVIEGASGAGTGVSYVTGINAIGSALQFGAAGGSFIVDLGSTGGAETHCLQFDFQFSATSAALRQIAQIGSGSLAGYYATLSLDTSNRLTLGSGINSAALTPGTWYQVRLKAIFDNTTGNTSTELLVNGVSAGLVTLFIDPAGGAGAISGGITLSVGAGTGTVSFDNLRINDATGTTQKSWPPTYMAILRPSATVSAGTGWQKPGGGTTFLETSIDNFPPVGVANSTSSTNAEKMIRNASSNAASATFNLQTIASLFVSGVFSGVVKALTPMVVVGAPATGKTGSFGLSSNPAITAVSFGTYYSGAAQGTYPTGWKRALGTLTESPTVDPNTVTGCSLNLTGGTATLIASCCFLGAYVEWDDATTSGMALLTLAPATVQAAGTLAMAGRAAITLNAALGSAAGALAVAASGSGQLAPLTSTATGRLTLTGQFAATLGPVQSSAAAGLAIGAAGGGNLGPAALVASGKVAIDAAAAIGLADTIGASAGALPVAANASSVLAPVSLASAAALGLAGRADIALGAAISAASAALSDTMVPITGQAKALLSAATCLAAGSILQAGNMRWADVIFRAAEVLPLVRSITAEPILRTSEAERLTRIAQADASVREIMAESLTRRIVA